MKLSWLQALVLGAIWCGCAGQSEPPPNLLLVTLDTTRADRLGPYGYGPAQTPALERLADEGVVFERHFTTAPITLPAHISILSGLRPPTHGVRDNGVHALSDEVTTLAEHLAAQGYDTGAFVSAAVLDARYNLDQGFSTYDDDLWAEDSPPMFMIPDRRGTRTAAQASDWLTQWAAKPERPPFFGWVHLFDPHQPHEPEAQDRVFAPTAYDAEIAGADRAIAALVATLEQLGTLDNTLIIVTADHGESLGEHGERTHAVFIYDATMHVPLVARFPERLPAGARIQQPTSAVDIVPTALAVLGLPPLVTEGVDLTPAIAGKPLPDRHLYMESLLAERGFGMAPLYGIRHGEQVWIRAPRPERYDVHTDPHQLDNLHPRAPEPGAAMDAALSALLSDSAGRAIDAADSPLRGETREMLMAMGYLAPEADRQATAGMDPKDGLPLHNKLEDARQQVRRGSWAEAEATLRSLLEALPENVTARNIIALVFRRQGKLEEAEAAYRRSLESDPQQYRVYLNLARLAEDRGDLEGARREATRALEITPDYVEGLVYLGVLAYRSGDEAAAEQHHQRALALDPDSAQVWRDLADLRYRQQSWAEALALYVRVTEANPRDFEAWLHAGAAALKLGELERSLQLTAQAAALRPDSWLPLYNQACAQLAQGDADAAMASLQAAEPLGLRAARQIASDSDLAALHTHPGWPALLRQLNTKP